MFALLNSIHNRIFRNTRNSELKKKKFCCFFDESSHLASVIPRYFTYTLAFGIQSVCSEPLFIYFFNGPKKTSKQCYESYFPFESALLRECSEEWEWEWEWE